jgi:hypothetical protein
LVAFNISPPRSRIRSTNFSTQPISSEKWSMYFSPNLVNPCDLNICPCNLCTNAPSESHVTKNCNASIDFCLSIAFL